MGRWDEVERLRDAARLAGQRVLEFDVSQEDELALETAAALHESYNPCAKGKRAGELGQLMWSLGERTVERLLPSLEESTEAAGLAALAHWRVLAAEQLNRRLGSVVNLGESDHVLDYLECRLSRRKLRTYLLENFVCLEWGIQCERGGPVPPHPHREGRE